MGEELPSYDDQDPASHEASSVSAWVVAAIALAWQLLFTVLEESLPPSCNRVLCVVVPWLRFLPYSVLPFVIGLTARPPFDRAWLYALASAGVAGVVEAILVLIRFEPGTTNREWFFGSWLTFTAFVGVPAAWLFQLIGRGTYHRTFGRRVA